MSATEWAVIGESDLQEPDSSGKWIRAYCRCHHGNRARSLSINTETGFGACFRCGNKVLVSNFNPKAAENVARSQGRRDRGEIRVRDPRFITPNKSKHVPTVPQWQLDELERLRHVHARGDSIAERGRSYITERGISVDVAEQLEVGYIPAGDWDAPAKWVDRIILPVESPTSGLQFVGRSLWKWEPGMDENTHKELLDQPGAPQRWIKTHAAGWFNFQVLQDVRSVVFVEGAFDALALLDTGLLNVVAVIGTAIEASWVPKHIQHATIAFDGDVSGIEKSEIARTRLYERGFNAEVVGIQDDGLGNDWSERYRLHDIDGVKPLWPPYVAEDRTTYCCQDSWLWNGERYVCQQCRGNHD